MAQNDNAGTALNHVIRVVKPAVKDKGEDAYAYSFRDDYGMIAVFDGCGGLGAQTYESCEGHTAAYIGARIAGTVTIDWFENRFPCDQNGMYAPGESVAAALKAELDAGLARARRELDVDQPLVMGTMIRSFPTTASVAVLDGTKEDGLHCLFLWAGDSRGYILQPDGLKQCTKDDLRTDEDAFSNLYVDSPLSNMVHGKEDYVLHARRMTCRMPAVVLTATDGVFGYLPSPMHFEWLLVSTLCRSRSFADWENRLRDAIAEVTGDDSTLIMSVWGWPSFEQMQAAFQPRFWRLETTLTPDAPPDEGCLRGLWQAYKPGYSLYENDGAEGGAVHG